MGIHGVQGIGLNSLEVLKNCDKVYVERYTSPISDAELSDLNCLICDGGKVPVLLVQRWFIEDGREIIKKSMSEKIALLVYGDPLIATTHTELCVRALKNSIEVRIIHGASGIGSLIGEIGLHIYKFGRTVTITSESQSVPSVYSTLLGNLILGNHTMILTEYDCKNGEVFFMNPSDAFDALLEYERDSKNLAFHTQTFAIIASRIGSNRQNITSGKVESLVGLNHGVGPHTIVITGSLHFSEVDALMTLTKNIDKPLDNTLIVQNKSANMLEKYVPQARSAIVKIRNLMDNFTPNERARYSRIVENSESYIEDAIRFLRTGKPELAVLCIGYAEGLLDALEVSDAQRIWD